ncbi:hypothetical protein NST08_16915 [Paenibacillus sp. FSL K6-1566]|uniref:hypothetical protein n=2 Tax=Paenibacillus TaxID=44249 RepID=UPI0002DB6CA3
MNRKQMLNKIWLDKDAEQIETAYLTKSVDPLYTDSTIDGWEDTVSNNRSDHTGMNCPPGAS